MASGSPEMQTLKTGVAEVDVEHQLQVQLVDALRGAVAGGREPAVLAELLQQLQDVSSVHFGSEELLMRLHAWERYEMHVEEHRRLLEELEALKARFAEGGGASLAVPLDQLQAWLAGHIRGADRTFAEYVAGGGLARPAPAR
jgi:hemerythrin-like metal-binding protein